MYGLVKNNLTQVQGHLKKDNSLLTETLETIIKLFKEGHEKFPLAEGTYDPYVL